MSLPGARVPRTLLKEATTSGSVKSIFWAIAEAMTRSSDSSMTGEVPAMQSKMVGICGQEGIPRVTPQGLGGWERPGETAGDACCFRRRFGWTAGDASAEPPDRGRVTAREQKGVRREIAAEAKFSSVGGRRRMLGTFSAAAAASERG